MSYRSRVPSPGRRAVLRGSLIAPAAVALSPATASAVPSLHLAGRPEASWVVQVGSVTASSALLRVRSDRPARMRVETSATESCGSCGRATSRGRAGASGSPAPCG